jgi:anthranilate synthase component I
MDFETFKEMSRSYNVIPVAETMLADTLTPVSAYMRIRGHSHASFLFESVEGGERIARYSFIGRNPSFVLRTKNLTTTLTNHRSTETLDGNYFEHIKKITGDFKAPDIEGLPRFTGGLVGFIGYDLIRHIERIPESVANDIDIDDALLGCFPTVLAFDHIRHRIIILANVIVDSDSELTSLYDKAKQEIEDVKRLLSGDGLQNRKFNADIDTVTANISRERYESDVRIAKEYIAAGDIFQVVLSKRFAVPYAGDVFNVYRALRIVNPSPYLYFLDFGDTQVIGSSPEILVRKEDNLAETYPIAGTRHRGGSEDIDKKLERELLADEKERAEHIMLVDLGRNDLGRVCEPGSVKVDELMKIVRYSHVMHIASQVTGTVKKDMTAVDVFKAAFPAGTVSGAPKVRAMEIIDELETTRRGIYAGGVGYFDFAGNMDTCIAIRTMYAKSGTLYFQAGAGIVADSDPSREYEETVNKSMAMRRAIEFAGSI